MFPPNTRVLIVDDMAMMRSAVKKFCTGFGLQHFEEACDGADAWQKAAAANPPFDLIISDWNMPNSTGLDLLKRVRADQRLKNTPIILVTAEKEKNQILEAIKSGVNGYVVKPFTPEALKEKLEAVHSKVAA